MRKVMTGFNHQMKDGVSDASREQLNNNANKAVLVPTPEAHSRTHDMHATELSSQWHVTRGGHAGAAPPWAVVEPP